MLAPHPDLKQRGGRVIGHLYLYCQPYQRVQVQNSFSPVGSIRPLHLGQVCRFQMRMLSLPQLRQSLPTSLLYDGATSAMMPPTTMFWIVLQSGHVMGVIC